jgi:Flp pilus assembly pilin Flp
MRNWMSILRRLVSQTTGQDLIEYALLLGIAAAIGIATFPQMQALLGAAYTARGNAVHDLPAPCPTGYVC